MPSSPHFDRNVHIDKMPAGEVAWLMAPKGQRKTITIENGNDFDIVWKAAPETGVLLERVSGAVGPNVDLNITGNMPRGANESLPVIRLRAKTNAAVEHVVKVLVLPPKKIIVRFFNLSDTPLKKGQAARRTTHDEATTAQMILEATEILKPANIKLQSGGLGTAKFEGQLPTQIFFTKTQTGDNQRNRVWREQFARLHMSPSDGSFSVFFVPDFESEAEPGALAVSERMEPEQRWYCFQKEATGGNDAKSLAHEAAHTVLGDFFAATKGHSPYKPELMWPRIEESGQQIYLDTARTMNSRAPTDG